MARSVRLASIGLSAGLHAALVGGLIYNFEAEPPPPAPALLEMSLPMPAAAAAPEAPPADVAEAVPAAAPALEAIKTAEPPPEIPPPVVEPPPPDAPPPDAVTAVEPPPPDVVEPQIAETPPAPEELITVDAIDAPVVASAPPPPPKVKPPKPQPVKAPKPNPTPQPPAPAPPAPQVAQTQAPGLVAAPTPPAPSSGPPPSYLQQISLWLERHKEYPQQAQSRRQQGTVMLHFVMDRRGRVLSHRITRSSGYAILDEEVEAMIRRAQPLPPMPSYMPEEQMEVVVPVQFRIR